MSSKANAFRFILFVQLFHRQLNEASKKVKQMHKKNKHRKLVVFLLLLLFFCHTSTRQYCVMVLNLETNPFLYYSFIRVFVFLSTLFTMRLSIIRYGFTIRCSCSYCLPYFTISNKSRSIRN